MTGFEINIINAILICVAAVIPLYLTFRLNGYLRVLTIALFVFVIVHALYHTVAIIGYDEIADNVMEPLSVAALIIFGLLYLKTGKKMLQ